jgi:hypothetical protein
MRFLIGLVVGILIGQVGLVKIAQELQRLVDLLASYI